MYFKEFESWASAVAGAKSFVIKVVVRTTDQLTSTVSTSAVPIVSLENALAQITQAIDCKESWTGWDRVKKEVVIVPYESIVSITVSLCD